MSIKAKILTLVILPVFVASGLVGGVSIHFHTKVLTEQLLNEGETLLYTLSVALKEPVVTRDIAKIREIVRAYGQMENILLVAVENPNKTLAAAPMPTIPQELKAIISSKMGSTNDVGRYWKVNIATGIKRGGTTYNSVYLFQKPIIKGLPSTIFVVMPTAFDLVVSTQKLLATSTGIIAGALALLVAMLAALVARGIAHNIMYLTEVAERISLGELDVKIEKKGDDEFGRLAEALERMRQSLKAAIERLRKRSTV
jgi:methyl-accepting chemotaxis protein